MHIHRFCLAFALCLVFLSALSRARADNDPDQWMSIIRPALVTPGDTFSFDVTGFNSDGSIGKYVVPAEDVSFGTTQTFTGVGVNGQNITIASSETVNPDTTTTDSFTISTPTNFLTTATVGGTSITQLQFDIGNANSGSDTVSLALPINTYTMAGNAVYGAGNTNYPITPQTTIGTGRTSYIADEGVTVTGTTINVFGFHTFTYSITYTSAIVPEPSAGTLTGLGAAGVLGLMTLRRRLKVAARS